MRKRIPPIAGCHGCRLGRPEIIGRQAVETGDTWFRVQCPTCAHGRHGPTFATPLEAVEHWNGIGVRKALKAADV